LKYVLVIGAVMLLSGCNSVHLTEKPNLKVTTVAATPLFSPANTITIVERPGKEEIVYASNDRSFLGIITPAAIGAVGGVIASGKGGCSNNCGDLLVSSDSSAASLSTSDNRIRLRTN